MKLAFQITTNVDALWVYILKIIVKNMRTISGEHRLEFGESVDLINGSGVPYEYVWGIKQFFGWCCIKSS
ncbi:hypothetical protein E1A91_D10G164600v1 [Gossypium mustelinum]|uniref:Uncharacterized protein n=1 Tax=Gossypium mustelinum TaxID=34275 RepID=A0A5D2T9D5_GOSMU|nr:hypothetical protein E1A91_D10G164600v1 [Gossypium mustelinum]